MKRKVLLLAAAVLLSVTCAALLACGTAADGNEAGGNITKEGSEPSGGTPGTGADRFYITVGGTSLTATFAANSSAAALKDLLKAGDITVAMHDYGNFEKVGDLGHTLPRNDERITTEAGDVILYQGNQITVYYGVNTWNFTRLGKIENVTRADLLDFLGGGNVTVIFSLAP